MDEINIKIPELSKEEESILEKNIVWLFGSPRGGTNWVAGDLLSYNTNFVNELHIEEHLAMRANEVEGKIVRRIDNPQQNPGYFFSEKYKDVWMFYLRKLILNRICAQTNDIQKKTMVKEVVGVGATEILSECLNKSKIIFLIRDGRDYLDSLWAAIDSGAFHTTHMPSLKLPGKKTQWVKGHSILWVNRINNFFKCYKQHPKELSYWVKYEDILKNTSEELEKLYKFIDVEISGEQLQKIVNEHSFKNIPESEKGLGKMKRSASPGKWRKNFTEEEVKIMHEMMGPMLSKLGYIENS